MCGSIFVPSILFVTGFMPVPYCSDFCSFVEYSEVGLSGDFSFVLLAQNCFGYSVHSVFSNKF